MQSRLSNIINRNVPTINQSVPDHATINDSEIEIVDVNSPRSEQSDLGHDSAMNEAWRFINQARQTFANAEDNPRKTNITHQRNKEENINETSSYVSMHELDAVNKSFYDIAQKIAQERNFFYATINDYLDELENSSEDEIPCKMKQNYFNNGTAEHNTINTYENPIYMDEGPVFIYSYKNTNCIPETNEEFINSPNKGSPVSSASSVSVETSFNEEKKFERHFYKISTYFNPVVIPRLPLEYMLPTVTEVVEPSRQSPKVTEINEGDDFLQRKTINSWVTIDEESTSEPPNKTDTSVENYADESERTKKQTYQVHKNTVSGSHQSESIKTDMVKNSDPGTLSLNEIRTHKTPQSNSRSTIILYNTNSENDADIKEIDNATDVIQGSMVFCGDDTFNSHSNKLGPSPRNFLSESSCIPSLRLSLSTEIDKINPSWLARFLKCIFCCKVK